MRVSPLVKFVCKKHTRVSTIPIPSRDMCTPSFFPQIRSSVGDVVIAVCTKRRGSMPQRSHATVACCFHCCAEQGAEHCHAVLLVVGFGICRKPPPIASEPCDSSLASSREAPQLLPVWHWLLQMSSASGPWSPLATKPRRRYKYTQRIRASLHPAGAATLCGAHLPLASLRSRRAAGLSHLCRAHAVFLLSLHTLRVCFLSIPATIALATTRATGLFVLISRVLARRPALRSGLRRSR